MKLIMGSQHTDQLCSICKQIATKQRRIRELGKRIRRWSTEPKIWKASIEAANKEIQALALESKELDMTRATKLHRLATASRNAAQHPVPDVLFNPECIAGEHWY